METNFLDKWPTLENFESFKKSAAEEKKAIKERRDYRMQNYFNCVDDYSWGGICDKVDDQIWGRLNQAEQLLKEQLENGKPFIEEFDVNFLADLDGNLVSDQIVNTRFGSAWIIRKGQNVSFVSCAKKQSTFNKKGYQLMRRVYSVEYYFTMKMTKSGLMSKGRILSERVEVAKDKIEGQSSRMSSILYFTLNN